MGTHGDKLRREGGGWLGLPDPASDSAREIWGNETVKKAARTNWNLALALMFMLGCFSLLSPVFNNNYLLMFGYVCIFSPENYLKRKSLNDVII